MNLIQLLPHNDLFNKAVQGFAKPTPEALLYFFSIIAGLNKSRVGFEFRQALGRTQTLGC